MTATLSGHLSSLKVTQLEELDRRIKRITSKRKCLAITLLFSLATTFFSLFISFGVSRSRDFEAHRADRWAADSYGFEQHHLLHSTMNLSMAANGSTTSAVDWLSLQNQRQRHLRSVCERLGVGRWTGEELKAAASQSNTLFVDDRRKYIYCLVPKVACTTWTRVLFVASGRVRETVPNNIPQNKINWLRRDGKILRPLARYTPAGIERRVNTYFKFMFVRHPFERLLSAYRDRMTGDHSMARRLILNGMKRISSVSDKRKTTGRRKDDGEVTFSDFVHYVVHPSNDPHHSNPHWRPMFDLCHPCHIHYDYIGHYDTLLADADVVIKRIGASHKVRFPFEDPDNRRQKKTRDLVREAFATTSDEDLSRLRNDYYRNDFELFGYDWSEMNGSITTLSLPEV